MEQKSKSHQKTGLAAYSHAVITSQNVPKMAEFFEKFFEVVPYYKNKAFTEFVLPNGFRLAFFVPTGAAGERFSTQGPRHFSSMGMTTHDVDGMYERAVSKEMIDLGVTVSGPPKEHPWGERSFLLMDPEGNRWEIAESPTADGMLVNRE